MKSEGYPVRLLCQALKVSPSGYYDWRRRQRQPAERRAADERLQVRIARIHQASHQTYGTPRIQAQLRREGCRHGRQRIARLMRQNGLFGRQHRRFRVQTTQSRHDQPIAPHRLAGRTAPNGPNQVWLADITYIATAQGWLYLAALLDAYSRRIVGWAMSEHLDTALVLGAWQMAVSHRQPPAGLVFHSDRGVQYASLAHREALRAAQAVASMSRTGNCYDNAMMESFWSTLKLELVYRRSFATRPEARAALFAYIEVFYNRQRLHSALGYNSPAEFEHPNN
jgi:putative transposase